MVAGLRSVTSAPDDPCSPGGLRRPRPCLKLSIEREDSGLKRHSSVLDKLQEDGFEPGRFVTGGSGGSSLRVVHKSGTSLLLKSADHEEMARRLEDEFKILKQVDGHENVVRALDWYASQHDWGFLMTFHHGVTLKAFYRTMVFDPRAVQAHHLAEQLVAAVAYLHRNKVTHRDLHSNNAIVETAGGDDGRSLEKLILIDFGSAQQQCDDESEEDNEDSPRDGPVVCKAPSQTSHRSRLSSRSVSFGQECEIRRLPMTLPTVSDGSVSHSSACRLSNRIGTASLSALGPQDASHWNIQVSRSPSLASNHTTNGSTSPGRKRASSGSTSLGCRMSSKCSVFAGESTMPLIMPPERSVDRTNYSAGPGSAVKRDAFALGLLLAGLVRRKNTETRDLYDGLELQREWLQPEPPLEPGIESVILGLVRLNPRERLTATNVEQLLPPAGFWFQVSEEFVYWF